MIDIHIHLLPGVDDGPRDRAEAVAMCHAAAEQGCEVLVATPHQRHHRWWNDDAQRLAALLGELQSELGDRPRLQLGGEVHIDSQLLDALDHPARAGVLPLAGSRYLLIEPSRDGLGPDPADVAHELKVAGWRPILAHPELVTGLAGDLEAVRRVVAAGALVQITGASLLGKFGEGVRAAARDLLQAGLVHFLASDAHGIRHRRPDLGDAYDVVAAEWGRELAWRLTETNPRAVLADRPLNGGPVPL